MPTFDVLDFVVIFWIVSEGDCCLVVTADCYGIALMHVKSFEKTFKVNAFLGGL
jgi:hypothetical protein